MTRRRPAREPALSASQASDLQSIRAAGDTSEDPQQAPLFPVARARNRIDQEGRLHRDPETSMAAARSVTVESMTRVQRAVMNVLTIARGPLSDEQIVESLRWLKASPAGIRSRRAELLRGGLIEVADEDGRTKYGNRSRRYRIAGAE